MSKTAARPSWPRRMQNGRNNRTRDGHWSEVHKAVNPTCEHNHRSDFRIMRQCGSTKGGVAKCDTPCKLGRKQGCFRPNLSPAGGLLNANGAQGRPFHTFPAVFFALPTVLQQARIPFCAKPRQNKKNPGVFQLSDFSLFWRSERDSNPRYAFDVHTISSRARYDLFDITP